MFKVGDYIIYGNNGVCKVEAIGTMDVAGIDKNKRYYTLSPIYANGTKLYTPVDNEKVIMRPILSNKEASDLINEVPEIESVRVLDIKVREQIYKDALRSCDCRELIKIIKTLYLSTQSRLADGKKATAVDDKYFKKAEELLYGELAIALKMDIGNVREYIAERVSAVEAEPNKRRSKHGIS